MTRSGRHDVDELGFVPRRRAAAQQQPQAEEEPAGAAQVRQIEVRLLEAQWKPGKNGFQFTQECLLEIKAEYLKPTVRKRVEVRPFVVFNGAEEDLGSPTDAFLDDKGIATATIPLEYGSAYYDALEDDPSVTCQYKCRLSHSTGEREIESELLDMPAVAKAVPIPTMSWSIDKECRGKGVTLQATFDDTTINASAVVKIYEKKADGAHQVLATLDSKVQNGELKAGWLLDRPQEPLAEQNPQSKTPELFFTASVNNVLYGEKQESGSLQFLDFIEIALVDQDNKPIANEEYIAYLPDGEERSGTLDANGYARIDTIQPGAIEVAFPKRSGVSIRK
jgi:hypothetical protein